MSKSFFFEQFREELQKMQGDYAPYLAEGAEIPDDEVTIKEVREAIYGLYDFAKQCRDDGNVTPEIAEYVAQGLDFVGELALIFDDDFTKFEIDALATEMKEFAEIYKDRDNPMLFTLV